MSCTLIHSRTEWYSLPPVKMFGVGRPISVSREPSVPPRIECEPRLEPDAPRRLERRLDDVRARGRAPRACCGTAPSARTSRSRAARPRPPPRRAAARAPRAPSSVVPVEVAEDQRDGHRLGAALDLVSGGRTPRVPRSSRATACPRGRLATNRAASLTGLTSLPFAVPGMDADAVEGHLQLDRRERLVLDLADDRRRRACRRSRRRTRSRSKWSVPCPTSSSTVNAIRARRARHLGVRDELGDRGHDLGDAGLVVGAEQRRPVGGDDVVPDPLGEQRARRGREPGARARRRRSSRAPAGSTPVAGRVGARVDVGEQPDRRPARRPGSVAKT